MEELLGHLTDVYRCLASGSCPQRSAVEVARAVFSGLCVHVRGGDASSLSLSLVHRLVSGARGSRFCREVLVELRGLDLLPQLVLHFQSEDQVVSHLAARSVSACVCYHLQESGAVSPAWQRKCVEAFQSAPPSAELDACLWSLTDVLKRLIKGARHDILGEILSGFDCSLLSLCSKFLPEGGSPATQSEVVFTHSSQQVSSFCLLLDLLEVLSASGVCAQSQRLIHARCPALLAAVGHGSEYFVRRKAALLLKRAALQRLGEDLALGGAAPSGLKQAGSGCQRLSLARSVLTAVDQDWLHGVQVRPAAFFGGTKQIRDGETQEADCVMLRAISLIVLKSIEIQIQTSGGAAVHGAPEPCVYVERLWGFLRRCSVQLAGLRHLCCWISLLFGEQDDDMMEAARALLALFLHHRDQTMSSGSGGPAVLAAACSSGFNPHCHFVLLLHSVSFDHSILLDFLISSETCFLEYLVRYLKCLRDDWPGFIWACGGGAAAPDCGPSLQESRSAPPTPPAGAGSCVTPPQRRLVDYDSSDGSDPEDMEVCDSRPGPPGGLGNADAARLPASPRHRRRLSLTDSPGAAAAPRPGVVTSARAVQCLCELREVVSRLHARKLFPYNPASLLKLLTQVEDASQQSDAKTDKLDF
ncbi:protein Lines homolog 1 isoform X1 [Salarias fasciatus]|uniref:protein Lines homolog 1 isoform X1 n=1 Tax=Salarias fasciatus TaxID=181472 RepID=UPI0011769427|nr:protein Lines homolog 1 isoform X1 [Salarias fasciatus]